MNLNKYIKHHELYEFLRTKVDIPPIERTFFSSEYDHTLYRMAWMASNKQCEVTLGCHEQPFLLLISRIGEDMRRIHIPVSHKLRCVFAQQNRATVHLDCE